ncbi:MAG: DnaJ domain-containing protein [Pseudomonadota bacterium]|nr:DnaJ domain-containing protein [Pseudomonadota bacterium]
MGVLILGITLLFALLFFLRWYSSASPSSLWRVLKWGGLVVGIVLVGFLLLRGGLQFLWVAAAFLVPWFLRIRGMRNWMRAAAPKSSGQTSTVRTRLVAMQLDHDTGAMDGEVLEGPYAGQRLSDLDLDDLIDLLHLAVNSDSQSALVLQSYLDRVYGDKWRDRAARAGAESGAGSGGSQFGGSGMTRDQAYEVLGLQPDVSEEDIKNAHRRLIREYHPDRGGSDYLAAKINEAKDLLLGG